LSRVLGKADYCHLSVEDGGVAGRMIRHAWRRVFMPMIDFKTLEIFKGIRKKSFELSLCPDG
jgi:hypothetical protein